MDMYLIMVVVLFALAISDLIVGVSNDAVNFLNSAIGAKVAPFKTIMIIAALGIIVGATFSSGMMEVARKGIMNPQYFHFSEIMLIFMAVMLTDIILLDMFNTFGMPTSTTVSIVFELLGASVAIAMFKIIETPELGTMATYINSSTALKIIGGILLSVVVAFVAGAIVQYISRLAFSFNFKNRIKYIGAIWGGIAITSITYFMLIKGLKESTYADHIMANIGDTYMGQILTEPVILKHWVQDFAWQIIIYSFIGWTVVFQILYWLFKLDVLKLTVLLGTFALAMAFAGNDLVNFIGVPLAGFESYKEFMANPGADPGNFLMNSLTGKVQTPASFLVIAGLIMVITLWTSKKARNVVKTSLDLSRQDEGVEKFGHSQVARTIVRASISMSENVNKITPKFIQDWSSRQFDQRESRKQVQALGADAPAFDMVRASVNLVMASILISLATSQKLPLSTTYVTFMVAMGTSLADSAWGRESAVYRITGVLSVILGWFFTAFIAFTAAFAIASLLYYTGMVGIVIMIAIALFLVYKTHIISKKSKSESENIAAQEMSMEEIGVMESCNTSILKNLENIKLEVTNVLVALNQADRKALKKANTEIKAINKEAKYLKKTMHSTISKLKMESEESGLFYVQVLDYLRELAHSLEFIAQPAYDHIENGHKKLTESQQSDLMELDEKLIALINMVIQEITQGNFRQIDMIVGEQQKTILFIREIRKRQVKRIKEGTASTKSSLLYFSIVHECNNIVLHMINLLKAQRDFVTKK
jgi:phosphate/sulfate permease